MQMQHRRAAGALVQVVDVLGHQGELGDAACELRDGAMRRIWLGAPDGGAAPLVPAPHKAGIAIERCGRGEFGRIEICPQAGLAVAEGGDAAFLGYTGPREDHDAPGVAECLDQRLRKLAETAQAYIVADAARHERDTGFL